MAVLESRKRDAGACADRLSGVQPERRRKWAPVESAAVYATPKHPVTPAASIVQQGSFLTLHYRLSGADGRDVVNTFNDRPATLSLGAGQLTPAIEQHLIGLPEGGHAAFDLPAGAAFGPRNAELVQRVKLSLLHELGEPGATYDLGDVVQFPTPDGQGQYAGVVRELGPDWVLFDFNHPLAGQPVRFEVSLLGVL
jgi:FKBP-type peptidyl-prolyl cis-trans isomerase SlpA